MGRFEFVRSQVDLPRGVAAWVLAAHGYALLMPLALVAVVQDRADWLATHGGAPALLPVAACVLMAASAFEIAQNAADRWYLVPGLGSTGAPALADLLFNFCLVAGQSLLAVALDAGAWVVAAAIVMIASQPPSYLSGRAVFAPLAASGVLVAVLGYRLTADPLVVLSLPVAGLTMYFFTALLRTGAQALHGFTTAAAASGLWFVVLALEGPAADHGPMGWATLALVVLLGAGVAATAWPLLLRLQPTRRRTAGAPLPR